MIKILEDIDSQNAFTYRIGIIFDYHTTFTNFEIIDHNNHMFMTYFQNQDNVITFNKFYNEKNNKNLQIKNIDIKYDNEDYIGAAEIVISINYALAENDLEKLAQVIINYLQDKATVFVVLAQYNNKTDKYENTDIEPAWVIIDYIMEG